VGNGVVEYLSTDSGADIIRFAGVHGSPLVIQVTNHEGCLDVERFIVEEIIYPALR
jgi:hypothetical protein